MRDPAKDDLQAAAVRADHGGAHPVPVAELTGPVAQHAANPTRAPEELTGERDPWERFYTSMSDYRAPGHRWVGCATVSGTLGTVGAAIGMFAGTNTDDLIVLTVLFLSARAAGRPKVWQIWVGQYTGVGVLVAASVVAALGLTIVPDGWVGLLGLVPLGLGVRGVITAIRARAEAEPASIARGLAAVVGVTVANGADNISVYTPVFRTIGAASTGATIAVFAVGVAAWCLAGSWLGSHKKVIAVVERYGHWIVPVVFIGIGSVIVAESGVLTRIF
ncbi:hypothetical protein Lfu02_04090 [Longispora fulva]|nr:hypothetical protein Lfu02_04090 [Longispora fulva]